MAHGTAVHVAAQKLYVEGAGFDEIVDRLRRDGTHVNRKALMRWAKNENWESGRDRALHLAQDKNEEKAADRWTRVVAETERLRSKVLSKLENLEAPKTMEGGVAAYAQLTRMLHEWAPGSAAEGDVKGIMDTVVKAFIGYPRIKVIWEQDSEKISEVLRVALAKYGESRG